MPCLSKLCCRSIPTTPYTASSQSAGKNAPAGKEKKTLSVLDGGSIALLDGKYLAMTTETLNQAVKDGLMMAIGDTAREQAADEEANDSSICAMCGRDDIAGTACSSLILETGYGSANDLERVTVPLCGECADRLYVEMTQMSGARIDDIQI